MSAISDNIERYLKQLLCDCNSVEVKRNELAAFFGCAPSQINYVLTTRFSVDQGYIIQSKRGGGGYVMIVRVETERDGLQNLLQNKIGQEISKKRAQNIISGLFAQEQISQREASIMYAAVSRMDMVPQEIRDYVRANILKEMILALVYQENVEKGKKQEE